MKRNKFMLCLLSLFVFIGCASYRGAKFFDIYSLKRNSLGEPVKRQEFIYDVNTEAYQKYFNSVKLSKDEISLKDKNGVPEYISVNPDGMFLFERIWIYVDSKKYYLFDEKGYLIKNVEMSDYDYKRLKDGDWQIPVSE